MSRLTLPSKAHQAKADASRSSTPGAPPRADPTILLIDDDPAVREGLRRVLATEGWHVIAAKTGEDALECLGEREPDLMITDLRMAPVSGWDLLFHENIQRPNLPIFVITALSLQATRGAASFATEFFQKPVDIEVLLAAVRHYLSRDSSAIRERHRRVRPRVGAAGTFPDPLVTE